MVGPLKFTLQNIYAILVQNKLTIAAIAKTTATGTLAKITTGYHELSVRRFVFFIHDIIVEGLLLLLVIPVFEKTHV